MIARQKTLPIIKYMFLAYTIPKLSLIINLNLITMLICNILTLNHFVSTQWSKAYYYNRKLCAHQKCILDICKSFFLYRYQAMYPSISKCNVGSGRSFVLSKMRSHVSALLCKRERFFLVLGIFFTNTNTLTNAVWHAGHQAVPHRTRFGMLGIRLCPTDGLIFNHTRLSCACRISELVTGFCLSRPRWTIA